MESYEKMAQGGMSKKKMETERQLDTWVPCTGWKTGGKGEKKGTYKKNRGDEKNDGKRNKKM